MSRGPESSQRTLSSAGWRPPAGTRKTIKIQRLYPNPSQTVGDPALVESILRHPRNRDRQTCRQADRQTRTQMRRVGGEELIVSKTVHISLASWMPFPDRERRVPRIMKPWLRCEDAWALGNVSEQQLKRRELLHSRARRSLRSAGLVKCAQ